MLLNFAYPTINRMGCLIFGLRVSFYVNYDIYCLMTSVLFFYNVQYQLPSCGR